MAKRNNDPTFGADKAKVRVFYAEVEGNNESVQDALKTMLAAMNRSAPAVRVTSEQKANGRAAVLPPKVEAEEVEEAGDEVAEAEVVEEEAAPPAGRKARGAGRKVDHNAGLRLVPTSTSSKKGTNLLSNFWTRSNPRAISKLPWPWSSTCSTSWS
jgi:hypothetical protein